MAGDTPLAWVAALALVASSGCAADVRSPAPLAWRPQFEDGLALLDAELATLDAQLEERAAPAERWDLVEDEIWVAEQVALLGARDRLVHEAWSTLLAEVPPLQRSGARARLSRRVLDVQSSNADLIEPLLDRHGWLTISDFGSDADRDAWRVIQHADADPELQARVLLVLEGLAEVGETDPAHYAYLADRVAVARGELQPFGTQGECVGDGTWRPFGIDDPGDVDRRRATVGLPPLAEYVLLAAESCP